MPPPPPGRIDAPTDSRGSGSDGAVTGVLDVLVTDCHDRPLAGTSLRVGNIVVELAPDVWGHYLLLDVPVGTTTIDVVHDAIAFPTLTVPVTDSTSVAVVVRPAC